ncbi:MAG: M28 family peptidase, partial [Acidobacteria bacterium]|nr:M28 family peptidase [Acidobacteriota bacterium]
MERNLRRWFFFIIIIFAVAFQPFYPGQSFQYILKIDKTGKAAEILLQHPEISIIQELETCYLGVTEAEDVSRLDSLGIKGTVLFPTSGGLDRMYLVYLQDLEQLFLLQQNGIAIAVEGNHVLFIVDGAQHPREILPPIFRGIKKLGDKVNIEQIPSSPVYTTALEKMAQIDPMISTMVGEVSKENIKTNIKTLQNFVTRDASTNGCEKAGDFLADALAKFGLQVTEDSFNFEGYTSRNIIGYLPGKTDSSKIVIISAHYDSYAEPNSEKSAPGADDNGSGCAAVLAAAKIMSHYSFAYSVKFIFFSAEEWGLYGSAHYAREAAQNDENIIGVINLDMVSYTDKLPEDLDVIVNKNSKSLGTLLQTAAQNYSTIDVLTTLDGSYDYSDHSSFWDRGFPAVLCIEDYEDTNPYYHSTGDTIDKINLDFATQATRVCLAGAAQLAKPDVPQVPIISLNRTKLNFGALIGGVKTGTQEVWVRNSGNGNLNWLVTDNVAWLSCTPISGTNSGIINVSVNPGNLAVGVYTGTITITGANASNSPQSISVSLTVKSSSQNALPFGEFATPADGAAVSSSFPVTGWVLDDIGIDSVKIYRESGGSLIFIGDAVLIAGTRPDVAAAYPGYPANDKAGWGYMLLSYFLPNGGNGTYKLHAIVTDKGGLSVTLGIKTITVDNNHSVKPFGNIDAPTQGGVASSKQYIVWGWVLTPQPNHIPVNGSTVNVWVDGAYKGHPIYNIYRSDIASLFPGYAN